MPRNAAAPTKSADVLSRRRDSDLPHHLAALYHGFKSFIDRAGMGVGLRQRSVRPGMGSVFLSLCEQDDCNIKDLVDQLRIPNATLTGLLDQMEQSGIIERHPCPDDGRAFRVRLTRLGRSLETDMRLRHQQALSVLQRDLSAAEVKQLNHLLARVLSNLRTDEEQHRLARKEARSANRIPKPSARRKASTA